MAPIVPPKAPKPSVRHVKSTVVTSESYFSKVKTRKQAQQEKEDRAKERRLKKIAQAEKLKQAAVTTRRALAAAAAEAQKKCRTQSKKLVKNYRFIIVIRRNCTFRNLFEFKYVLSRLITQEGLNYQF